MKENICTIPVNEVFEKTDGCPICRIHRILEAKYVDYITGPAMMEPDVRIETNRLGFCERHYSMLLTSGRARLPVALILDSHLTEVREKFLSRLPDKKSLSGMAELDKSCFVCDCIKPQLDRYMETICLTYKNEPEFRALYNSQPYICLKHYGLIMQNAKKPLGKEYDSFARDTLNLVKKYAEGLQADITGFRDAFDYRNAGKPMSDASRNSIERTICFLTGESDEPADGGKDNKS